MRTRTLGSDWRRLRLEQLECRALLSIAPAGLIWFTGGSGYVDFDSAVEAVRDALASGDLERAHAVDGVKIGNAKARPTGDIHTEILVDQWDESLPSKLTEMGISIESLSEKQRVITAWLPLDKVDAVEGLSGVQSLKLPSYGFTRTGSITSAGDAVLQADDARAQFGVSGSGVKVGVISLGVAHLGEDELDDDLPTVTVNELLAGPSTDDEGTAMLEIVHDIAPDAQLYFSTGATKANMIDSIDWMISQGVDVIVDDIGYFDEPFFEDGAVANAVAAAISGGVTYVSAAGNDGFNHYQAAYSQGAATSGGNWHNFSGSDDSLLFALQASVAAYPFTIALQWSDPFGSSTNNYDLFVYEVDANGNPTGDPLFTSELVQGTQRNDPYEILPLQYSGADTFYAVRVKKLTGAASNRTIELFATGAAGIEYPLATDSIFGHPAVESAIAVGAVNAATPSTIADYSSRGLSTIFTNFTSQSSTTRQVLDGVATDAVLTVTGQEEFSGFFPIFFGTSAAAPHVAGIAALMLDAVASLSPADVAAILATTAIDLGTTGYDTTFGYGRFDALAAVQKTLFPWHNFALPEDISNNGVVTLQDLNMAISELLANGEHVLTTPTDWNSVPPGPHNKFLDVNGDNSVTYADVAIVLATLVGGPAGIVVPVSPDPRNTPVSSVNFVFSEPVSGLTLNKLSLTNGGGNLLTGSQTLTSSDNIHWTVGNLSPITAAFGTYALSLDMTGVTGGGVPVGAFSSGTWDMIPWQNVGLQWDVDNSGIVTLDDAEILIDYFLASGHTITLVTPTDFSTVPPQPYGYFYDVNGDNESRLTDVIILINYLLSAPPPAEPLVLAAEVVGRHIFYNQSDFDGNDAAAGAADSSAIATDKTAYLPGAGLITFSSVTSYTRGINGIMVDITGTNGTLTVDDFTFRVSDSSGANNTPSTWSTAPTPVTVNVLSDTPSSGIDRVEIIWANNDIKNRYLQVIVEGADEMGGFNLNTGLAASDVFFFGNRIADSGTSTPATIFQTTTLDAAQIYANLTGNAAIDNLWDYNRSGNVTTTDAAVVYSNLGTLKRINLGNPPAAPEGAPETASDDGSASGVASALAARAFNLTSTLPAPGWLVERLNSTIDERRLARPLPSIAEGNPQKSLGQVVESDWLAADLALDNELLDSLSDDLLPA